jgi:hypothetical protein
MTTNSASACTPLESWAAHQASVVREVRPELLVLFTGGNALAFPGDSICKHKLRRLLPRAIPHEGTASAAGQALVPVRD